MENSSSKWSATEEPIYNIGVVSRMTGIPVATLRVWERRYKFPRSDRTAGGHRLYSERELVRLRWVKSTIDQGMQTSQAIRALRSREREGRIPELAPASIPAPLQPAGEGSALTAFQVRLTEALLGHDLQTADRVLSEILAVSSLEDIILNVIRPTLAELGQGWADGEVTVATEHLATQFLRHHLMMWMVTGPPAHPIRPIVLACAPGEWHEVSLLMLGVLLRRRRWPVAYLGQSVPLEDLARFVEDMRPPAIALVAMTEEPARELLKLKDYMPDAIKSGRPAITYGGFIYNEEPELQDAMPGMFLGETLQEGVTSLERVLLDTMALSL